MDKKNLYLLDSYDYFLPEERIAQTPAAQRQQSRLLYMNRKTGCYSDCHFEDIIDLMPDNALIIANNSKVIPARITGHRINEHGEQGAQIEMLFLEPAPLIDRKASRENTQCTAITEVLLKGAKRVKIGENLQFPDMTITVLKKRDYGKHLIEVHYENSLIPVLKKHGSLPLPPYIKREQGISENDITRYQTVYAKEQQIGSIAAPTAGLHFTEEIRQKLLAKGCEWEELTLHVGYGTFSPVRVDDIREHPMHAEYVEISEQTAAAINRAKAESRPIIAIGTTSSRSLEGMAEAYRRLKQQKQENNMPNKANQNFFCNDEADLSAETCLPAHGCFGYTDIFLYPEKEFHVINGLVTNFHLPKSTLIMLVCAFAGYENTMQAYRHAVESKYRFFSYGDSMFIY